MEKKYTKTGYEIYENGVLKNTITIEIIEKSIIDMEKLSTNIQKNLTSLKADLSAIKALN